MFLEHLYMSNSEGRVAVMNLASSLPTRNFHLSEGIYIVETNESRWRDINQYMQHFNTTYVSELLRGLKGSPTLLSILSFIDERYSL